MLASLLEPPPLVWIPCQLERESRLVLAVTMRCREPIALPPLTHGPAPLAPPSTHCNHAIAPSKDRRACAQSGGVIKRAAAS
jgi:hypothetical protein